MYQDTCKITWSTLQRFAGACSYYWMCSTSYSGFEKDRSTLCNIEPVDGAVELDCDSASEMIKIGATPSRPLDMLYFFAPSWFLDIQQSFGELPRASNILRETPMKGLPSLRTSLCSVQSKLQQGAKLVTFSRIIWPDRWKTIGSLGICRTPVHK
jgi:hypothetical protein